MFGELFPCWRKLDLLFIRVFFGDQLKDSDSCTWEVLPMQCTKGVFWRGTGAAYNPRPAACQK